MNKSAEKDRQAFLAARDYLLEHRESQTKVNSEFRWPRLTHFNWAIDYFDRMAQNNDAAALWIRDESGDDERLSFAQLSQRSNQVANLMCRLGVRRGDRLLVILGNEVPLWETMLAAFKLGAVVVPATGLLTPEDLRDRMERGRVQHVVTSAAQIPKFDTVDGDYTRICTDEPTPGWERFDDSRSESREFVADEITLASDPLLLYFTSGTTSKPKLVLHSHQSYPVGHLSTMFWLGLRPGDIHLNISSPGWAKHAWSCFFAPWNAGACVFVHNVSRFSAATLLAALEECEITTFCAPPTVWRMVVQEELASRRPRLKLREVIGAGEPLNPEIIERIQQAWGLTLRDGFGQTETTAQIGNAPGQPLKPGAMGRPLPGYRIALLDTNDRPADEGEVCIELDEVPGAAPGGFAGTGRPIGIMDGYQDSHERTAEVMRGGYYHTGDVAMRDSSGYLTFIGRADDVFKASDYRISPFELESVILAHPAVVEVAVVPSPDPVRLAVPKAFVAVVPEKRTADRAALEVLAFELLTYARQVLAPYQRVRRLEIVDELPKTISGKIRRVDLRQLERDRRERGGRADAEFFEEDFPQLKDH